MRLTELGLNRAPITDISVLRGMPLQHLGLKSVPVSDISVLAGMQLTYLQLAGSKVTDISVLEGMPFEFIDLRKGSTTDVSIFKNCTTLKNILLSGQESGIESLRNLSNTQINGKPAAEFWKEYDAKGK